MEERSQPPAPDSLLRNSTLYREFLMERAEILKHKWIASEKAGGDIGFEQALTDWITQHRAGWRASRANTPRSDPTATATASPPKDLA